MIAHLKEIFKNKLRFKSAVGVDRIRPEKFEKDLDKELSSLNIQIQNSKFKFRPYKELLISKGRGKYPRVVSIPTVRDKLVLTWLLGELNKVHPISDEFIYNIITNIKTALSSSLTYYCKIDISGFYDNINHDLLFADLNESISSSEILNLVKKAITNPTVALNTKPKDLNCVGVPQGIPISNYLANFFGKRIDRVIQSSPDVFYVRYVDDILILAKTEGGLLNQQKTLIEKIKSSGLSVNIEKTKIGELKEGLDFLGYSFALDKKNSLQTNARRASYQKHYLSILKIFSSYASRKNALQNINMARFIWDLNLKITGAIIDGDRYGWLFFFSQVDEDCTQLYALDSFIDEQLQKNGLSRSTLKIKKHTRALKEIRRNLRETTYIPKDENFSLEQKKHFLTACCDVSTDEINVMGPENIEYAFKKAMYKDARQLEKDRGSTS